MSQTTETQIAQHVAAAQAHEAAATAHQQDHGITAGMVRPTGYAWHLSTVAKAATLAVDPTGIADGWEEALSVTEEPISSKSAAELHGHAAKAHWAAAKNLRESLDGAGPVYPWSDPATLAAHGISPEQDAAALPEGYGAQWDDEDLLAHYEALIEEDPQPRPSRAEMLVALYGTEFDEHAYLEPGHDYDDGEDAALDPIVTELNDYAGAVEEADSQLADLLRRAAARINAHH